MGTILEERQFGAWGTVDRFRASDGTTTFGHNSLLGRGYTGHEHFFEVGLIHMNGRMYDAQLGRFLSPDNYVQDPYNTQNFNRYGYVLNNPLIFNDFTGESFWRSVGRWFKKNWKQVVTTVAAIAVTVAVTVLTAGTATPFVIGLYAGGAGGLTSGILGTALNGGSLTDILINGALGAATGALFGGVGSYAASFAPAGIVNGALYGAASNAALGGLADLAMGGDGVRGALWGGAIGLVSGGYTGFAKAKAAGANVWSGKVKRGNSLGSARSSVRSYLKNVEKVPRNKLIKDLEGAGFKKVFDGKGMKHFQRGNWKIRLDPPHLNGKNPTPFNHMHINRGGNKNAFDIFLNPVSPSSPRAHIPIK